MKTGYIICDQSGEMVSPEIYDTVPKAKKALLDIGDMNNVIMKWTPPESVTIVSTVRHEAQVSYKVSITQAAREMGLEAGDQVKVTISRIQ